METEQVKDHFRRQVSEYEDLMRRIIPEYDFQAQLMLDLIPFDRSAGIRVIDLGSGPGTLSELVLDRYPNATVLAIDITDEMVSTARSRCGRFADRFSAMTGDFGEIEIPRGFDLVLAGLSLHHLNEEARLTLLSKLYPSLHPEAAFVSREVVIDPDPYVSDWHYRMWRQFMDSNGEDGATWFQRHLAKDHPATIDSQLAWLKSAGFAHAACHWRFLNFAVLSAHK